MKTLALIFTLATLTAYGRVNPVEELAAKYKRASSERERMAICIEAIDRGFIHVGGSVKIFDAIFGTKLTEQLPERGQPWEKGGVNFAEQLKIEREDEQTPFIGWYCQVEFDDQGTIRSYFLSNMHK